MSFRVPSDPIDFDGIVRNLTETRALFAKFIHNNCQAPKTCKCRLGFVCTYHLAAHYARETEGK